MEILSNIHLIPSRIVNCYLIVEPAGLTLIDAGISAANVLTYIEGLAKQPTDLKRIIITHADADHIGALAELKASTGALVYSSPIEAQAIAAARLSRTLKPGLQALMFKIVTSIVKVKPARVDELLRDGQELSIAGGLQVVETPGHTPGHISLYAPASGVLFCGDSMSAGRNGRLRCSRGANTWDEEKARESVRIQQALGAEIVCAGHGPVVREAADKFPTL